MKKIFLASFVPKKKLSNVISNIFDNFDVVGDKIITLTSDDQPNIFVLVYNIMTDGSHHYNDVVRNTIPLHRKTETNTLYTLNALNEVVKKDNDGNLDPKFSVDWENYRDSILVFNEELKIIPTKLYRIFYRRNK